MAPQIVLDTSAILAVLLKEPGGAGVIRMLPNSMLSAVNHAEVGANLSKRGFAREDIQRRLAGLVSVIVAFDSEQSLETIRVYRLTQGTGLSLADRACLALARLRKTPVLTTDKKWSELRLGVDVRQIR